ncbi:MAG: cupin [Candidatus Marinimicrobia bacterium]|nr:cupin [Candidatus Neomarinimicrobiota bacterium]|tara:strand:- start:988 stop:1362 length:375 start_codon:yes stop_codon:yes gene_type:complete
MKNAFCNKINFIEKLSKFSDHWSPKIIAEMNNYQFKLVKIKGDFIWHDHKYTDETFIVLEGDMVLKLRDKDIKLVKGEMYVVPKGVEHKPYAENECKILIIEPRGVVNTGDVGGDYTIYKENWI